MDTPIFLSLQLTHQIGQVRDLLLEHKTVWAVKLLLQDVPKRVMLKVVRGLQRDHLAILFKAMNQAQRLLVKHCLTGGEANAAPSTGSVRYLPTYM